MISVFTSSFCSFFINKVCTPLLCLTSKLHHWGHANLPTVQHWIDIWQLCSWHYIQFTRKFQSLSYDLKPLSADQSQHFLQYFEFKEIENVNPNFFRNNWHLQSIFHFQTIFSFFHTFRGVFTYANYFFHFQKFIVLINNGDSQELILERWQVASSGFFLPQIVPEERILWKTVTNYLHIWLNMARVYNSLRPKKFVYKTLEIVDCWHFYEILV